jgi:MFS family permease
MFFLYAATLGGILSRLADVQRNMDVAEGALGVGLLGMALGTQIALVLGGGLVERLGLRRTILCATPVLALGQIAASTMPGIPGFFLCLMVAGFAVGMLEIVLNLEADRAEFALGRRIMNRAHSFWSFGFFASGLSGALGAALGLSPTLNLVLLNAVTLTLTLWLMSGVRPAPHRFAHSGAPPPRFVAPTPAILGLVLVTLSAMLMEGAGNDWSIIYMRDTFGTPAWISTFAFATGALAQALTRLFADPFIDRFGPETVARTLLKVLGVGSLIVTFSPAPALSLAGFALMGIGTAVIFPLAVSAAAQRTDRPAAVNIAALAQTSFVIFLIAPPLLGFIAEHFGIRSAFGLGLPLVALSLVLVRSLHPR